MNAFDAARGIEAQAMTLLFPYLQEESGGRLVLTSKGTLSKWLQESVGDALLMRGDVMEAVELKAEQRHTGNVFLETWSNRNLERREDHACRGQNPGWLMKVRADLLLYYFIDKDVLYSFDVFELKRWFFGQGEGTGVWGSGRFQERCQRRYTQRNDTWGVIVPLRTLHDEMADGAMRWTKVRQRQLLGVAA